MKIRKPSPQFITFFNPFIISFQQFVTFSIVRASLAAKLPAEFNVPPSRGDRHQTPKGVALSEHLVTRTKKLEVFEAMREETALNERTAPLLHDTQTPMLRDEPTLTNHAGDAFSNNPDSDVADATAPADVAASRDDTTMPPDEATLGNSIEVLKEMAFHLLQEVKALSHTPATDVKRGIDFYEEVRRFEIDLIRRALEITDGHQSRAARLLHLKVTTLNSMMKRYDITPSGAATATDAPAASAETETVSREATTVSSDADAGSIRSVASEFHNRAA
ncbi:MAG TPA: helix-turn-helix domain-containing protein [Pyrinomonadaceae bacterium]